ncbi:hypothetical protein [Amycolatopsis sp. NBC_01480]|uniref:hypothetical protein n=1 Tax=Amycolatopsis sp. NBC_01480 TaxID=2903562 RepID=UPI002E2B7822|nr:hypothetical protein [Amycolatopsis sp. NBC_01480]
MAPDTVSLPLGFDVPEGWTPLEPAEAGAPGVVFVAVHREPGADFTPNITLGVRQRPDPASMAEIAEEAVERLGRTMALLDVAGRQEIGDATAPGVTQVLRMRTGEGQDLVQTQVHLSVPGPDGPVDRVVLELVFTAAPEAAQRLTPDFRQFVASVRLRRKNPAGEGEPS